MKDKARFTLKAFRAKRHMHNSVRRAASYTKTDEPIERDAERVMTGSAAEGISEVKNVVSNALNDRRENRAAVSSFEEMCMKTGGDISEKNNTWKIDNNGADNINYTKSSHQYATGDKKAAAKQRAAVRTAKKTAKAAGGKTSKNVIRTAAADPILRFILLIACIAAMIIVVIVLGVTSVSGMIAQDGLMNIDTRIVQEIESKVNDAWYGDLQKIRAQYDEDAAYTEVRVRYNASDIGDSGESRVSNWNDVWAIWLVMNDRVLTENDYESVKEIYYLLNTVSVSDEDISEAEGVTQKTAVIDISNQRYNEVDLGLSQEQLELVGTYLSGESADIFKALIGNDVAASDSYLDIYAAMPSDKVVTAVLDEARRHEGWRYDNDLRMRDGYDDCSSLVWKCYMAAGIDFGDSDYAPTAAETARWCEENRCLVDAADRQAGDLIFWAYTNKSNGRFRNIYHVAIYVGAGKMWEASPSAGGVVFRDVTRQRPENIIYYARPAVVKR